MLAIKCTEKKEKKEKILLPLKTAVKITSLGEIKIVLYSNNQPDLFHLQCFFFGAKCTKVNASSSLVP